MTVHSCQQVRCTREARKSCPTCLFFFCETHLPKREMIAGGVVESKDDDMMDEHQKPGHDCGLSDTWARVASELNALERRGALRGRPDLPSDEDFRRIIDP